MMVPESRVESLGFLVCLGAEEELVSWAEIAGRVSAVRRAEQRKIRRIGRW
jgi:hypothetical protein